MNWTEACHVLRTDIAPTTEQIKKQYRFLANLLHPDKNQNQSDWVRLMAEQELKRVNDAFVCLNNSANRPINPKLNISPKIIKFDGMLPGQVKRTEIYFTSSGSGNTKIAFTPHPAEWATLEINKVGTNSYKAIIAARGIEPGCNYQCLTPVRITSKETGMHDEVIIGLQMVMKKEGDSKETDRKSPEARKPTTPRSSKPKGSILLKTDDGVVVRSLGKNKYGIEFTGEVVLYQSNSGRSMTRKLGGKNNEAYCYIQFGKLLSN